MKALVFHAPRKVSVDEVKDPKIEHPLDAIIHITTANICGSDMHPYEGRADLDEGMVLAHENMGVVEEVGSAAGRIRVGDRVVIPFNLAVIARSDISVDASPNDPADTLGRLAERVILDTESIQFAHGQMLVSGQQRLAVIDRTGSLLGLLCLKRSRAGFCTEQDIQDCAAPRTVRPAEPKFAPDYSRACTQTDRTVVDCRVRDLCGA